ncbi:MAG TPA: penicillin acylase family protein, partial [bacterium]|nr:penicillin acylase family protein [bacterium]
MPAIRPLLIAACVVATLASLGGPRPPMLDAAPAAAAPPKTFALEGLHGPVTVRRDSYGIPHIQATDAHDLFMAFGFVQAGDRLWQMDATRRTAQGRLAELSGPRLLDLDKWFRTLGIPRVAREIVAEMDPETLAILQAFSDGVNAYLEQFPERTEGEFKFLSYRMDPWTPYDSACVMRMVSWWLSGDYDKELFAHLLEQNLGPDLTDAIFPLIPDARRRKAMRAHYPAADGDPAVEAAVAAERWTASVGSRPAPPAAPAFEIPAPTGSNPDNGTNIWVIHGSRTASGTPILANDPHLQLFAPSVWYEAQLTGGDFDVIGFTFPGMPIVAIGHNRHLAWGASNYPADSQDLFRVEVSADRRQYRTFPDRGSWQPLEITTEEILVRNTDPEQLAAGAPPMLSETLAVYHTAYGPLVRIEPDHTALALAWMGLTASQEIDVFLHAARAESVGELQRIFTGYGSPTQNFYAFDTAGRIGAIHAGKIPKRVRGERGIPVDSADPDAAWNGLVPYDSLGQVIDPPEGFLANANNKPVEAEEATGARFTPPLRYRRIQELLAARTDWTPDDARRMQTDTVNLAARDMVVALNALPLPATGSWSDPTAEGWYRRLLRWDANQRSDEAPDEPGPRLRRRQVLEEPCPPELAADEVGAGVVRPDGEHQQDDPPPLGAEPRERRRRRHGGRDVTQADDEGEQRRVERPEHGRHPGGDTITRVRQDERADRDEDRPDRDEQQ